VLTGAISVAIFAIPASMLTWGFEAEAERCAKKTRQKYMKNMQEEEDEDEEINDGADYNRPYADYISSSSEDSDGDTTDEEYLDIIAGGAEEEGEGGEGNGNTQNDVVKQLIRTFQTSDTDASGSLSMDEFIELMTDPSSTSQQLTMVGMATSVGLLAQRVQNLEQELKQTHHKLDQIVNAVVKKKK
jgi:polyhydroxyalkanoate synthesis regulator phasin